MALHLEDYDVDELQRLKDEVTAIIGDRTVTELCLLSIADSLITIKNKVGRRWR